MQHDPLFSEMKEGLFPYKMRLVCAKNYDYSQRLALILSSHGTYYLLDCFKTLNEENYDRIALMCNSYGKMNDAINDMEILSSGFGGYDAYLVPREEADKPF